MEETRLTTRPTMEAQVMVPKRHLTLEGLEDLTLEEDLILPRWRLVQYTSTITGEPGQFNNNLTDEVRDFLDMIVIKISPSRAYFNDDRELVCTSQNAIQSVNGRPCAGCEFAQWGDDGEPPPCNRGYTFVCLDPIDNSLCLIGAMRTGIRPAKLYISKLAHKKKPPFVFLTQFSSLATESPKGKYFVLDIRTITEQNQANQDRARHEYLALATVQIKEVQEPTAADDGFWPEEERELPF